MKIPEVLTKGNVLSDPKMLATMPSFEDFDGDFPQTGFSHNFLERIRDYALHTNEAVLGNFSPGGGSVVLGCISETVSFLSRLMV